LIGPDATCVLSASDTSIVVTLTDTSTFTRGDLKLNTLVLIGKRSNLRIDVSPLTVSVVLVAGSPPALTSIITAPSISSLSCNKNSLLLKGDSSVYFKRFGISYSWTVTGAGLSAAITGTASSLAISPTQLSSGTLSVSLTITNLVGGSNLATSTLSIVGSPYLGVTKAASFYLNQRRDKQIVIGLDISNRCGTDTALLSYAWSYVSTNSSSFSSNSLNNIARTSSTYTIPPKTLIGSNTYTFRALVNETLGSNVFTGETTIILTITNEDLVGNFFYTNCLERGLFSTLKDLAIRLDLNNLLYNGVLTLGDEIVVGNQLLTIGSIFHSLL